MYVSSPIGRWALKRLLEKQGIVASRDSLPGAAHLIQEAGDELDMLVEDLLELMKSITQELLNEFFDELEEILFAPNDYDDNDLGPADEDEDQ